LTESDPAVAFELGERDWEGGFANLFWAASNNDSVAQMALGYRHMHGLGVEQSCATAMLYYHQAAEKVVELARHPNRLPKVKRPSSQLPPKRWWRWHATQPPPQGESHLSPHIPPPLPPLIYRGGLIIHVFG